MSAFLTWYSPEGKVLDSSKENRVFAKLSPAENSRQKKFSLQLENGGKMEVYLLHHSSHSAFSPNALSLHSQGDFTMWWAGEVYAFAGKPNRKDDWVPEFLNLLESRKLEEVLPKINGKFALGVLDQKTGNLQLARDKQGMKTLFYGQSSSGFLAGSSIRSLLATGEIQPEVNWEGLWHALSFPAPPQPHTCFQNIYSLKRGECLSFKKGISLQTYHSIAFGNYQKESLESAASRLNSSFETGISRLIDSDEKGVGTLISGGVDSTYVSAVLAKNIEKVNAYSFGLDPKKYGSMNEVSDAERVAKAYGLNFHPRYYDFESLHKPFQEVIDIYEQPGLHLATNYFLTGMAKEGGDQILFNGLAADEQHGGFHYFQYIDLWKMVKTFPALVYLIPRGGKKKYEDLKNLKLASSIDEYYSHGFSTLKEFEKKKLISSSHFNSYEAIRQAYGDGSRFENEVEGLLYYMFANVPNHHLYRFEMFSLHHGLEPRYPFLEDGFVEASASIDPNHKIVKRERKVALKHAAKNYVPEDLLFRKKRGLSLPIGDWINGPWKVFVEDHLEGLKNREGFLPEYIESMNQMYRETNPGKIMKLVMVEVWFRHFIDGGYTA